MPEIIKQIKERHKIDLQCNGINFEIWRIDDAEYRKLRWDHSFQVRDYCEFYNQQSLSQMYGDNDNLNLAELFTALECLLGESSNFYDEYKGSFNFHNLLVIKRENGVFFYLLTIYDHRGFIQFGLARILENTERDKYNLQILYDPLPSEFSKSEINYFFTYFYGFLTGYFNSKKSFTPRQNFLKKVDSNLILYGYKDGEYFEEEYDSQEPLKAKIDLLKEEYGISVNETDVAAVLQKITSITEV